MIVKTLEELEAMVSITFENFTLTRRHFFVYDIHQTGVGALVRFGFKEKYIPANDVVFSIMFGNRYLFQKLLQAVLGKNAKITDDPFTQATIRENATLNSIRFDVFSKNALIDGLSAICSIDMQRSYWTRNIKRRVVYYASRSISTQRVEKSEYHKLKPVVICFVMSEKADNETGIRRVVLCYEDTHEIFDDLINMYLVYVPTVITNNKIKNDLYIFARFFAVISSEEAARFCDEFKENGLAKELVRLYNEAVFDEAALEVLGSQPYYTEREYLMDKAEWEQEKNALKQEKNALKQEKNTLEQEKNTLEEEKNTWEQEKNTLEEEKNTWEQEKNTLEEEKNTLEQENAKLLEIIGNLKKDHHS